MVDGGDEPFAGAGEEEVEATELWHRRDKEVQEQLERRRSTGTTGEEEPLGEAPEDVGWDLPPEARPRARGGRAWLRFGGFVLALLLGYGVFHFVTDRFFAPRLDILEAVAPAEPVEPNRETTVGIRVRNPTGTDGAAYAVMVREDGSEVEGPVVPVPARETVVVPVAAAFTPGDHVVSLILFDAWEENVRVGEATGVLVRSGETRVHVIAAVLPDSSVAGEPLLVEITVANEGEREEYVSPVTVFVRPSTERTVLELEGSPFRIPRGDTLVHRFTLEPRELPPGAYSVALLLLSPNGERVGRGIHGLPWTLHD